MNNLLMQCGAFSATGAMHRCGLVAPRPHHPANDATGRPGVGASQERPVWPMRWARVFVGLAVKAGVVAAVAVFGHGQVDEG
jgi:hypothetical protein